MFKYKINVKRVSGRLNESVLPSKSLVVKSKNRKSDRQVFEEASKFFKKKYGLVIESADVITQGRYAPGKSYKAGGVEYMDETQDYVGAVVFLSPTEYKLKFFKTQSAADKFITKQAKQNLAKIRRNGFSRLGALIDYVRTYTTDMDSDMLQAHYFDELTDETNAELFEEVIKFNETH